MALFERVKNALRSTDECESCGGPLKNRNHKGQVVRFCSKLCRLVRHNAKWGRKVA
jgi:endogenous inhibitor of DNA gyrase (YacG/DUF329 family)